MRHADEWDLAANVIGLLGIVALSVPALYANRYGRLLYKLSRLKPRSEALQQASADLKAELTRLRDSWTWQNGALLIGGTALAGVSYALGILKAVLHPS